MLTVKENERLTRVGPGTPMGELMRRYWQPIGAAAELEQRVQREVRERRREPALFFPF